MVARMPTIRRTDIWNVSPIALKLEPSTRKEEDTVDIVLTDEENEFEIDPDNVDPRHVEVQRVI